MNMSPVILRELRAESWRPWNYWARLSAGGLVICYIACAVWPGVSRWQVFSQASAIIAFAVAITTSPCAISDFHSQLWVYGVSANTLTVSGQ